MSTLTLPALLLMLSLFGGKTTVAFNQVKGMLYKKCDETQVISMVESKYDASFKDRQWNTACKNLKQLSECSWSPLFFLTSGEIKFNCPANQVINAIYSGYDHETKERNWSFRCCGASNLVTFECSETPMINFFKENFIWPVPGDNYLTGVTTYFSNGDGDHRWGFSYCRGIDLDGVTINSKIISSNSPISHYMEEGDVMKSTKRNANVCSNCKWPKINGLVNVPYKLTEDFSSDEKQQIQNSMSSFHLNTCVRFVPQSTQSSWVNIVKNSGCWSWIGRTGGRQDLSLGSGCVTHGIIQHELIHALGFWHEQSRTDRDLYVRIHLENVLDGYQRNFDLHETNNLNVPYDYSSIMHYGSLDFSRNNRFTITPIQTSATIGQRVQMTENDILKINKLYDCGEDNIKEF
uniref:Metalloendopeptidase n=1 Tax=Cynoglossus semilaevis TaxID=244447 RepID=A0A3P8W886_CYNSE